MIDLKELRKEKGLSQLELGQRCGVSRQMICEIERGAKNPSVNLAKKLGKLLNVKWYLFFE